MGRFAVIRRGVLAFLFLKRRTLMNTNDFVKYIVFVVALTLTGCATFEPGLRYQDLTRPRQPDA